MSDPIRELVETARQDPGLSLSAMSVRHSALTALKALAPDLALVAADLADAARAVDDILADLRSTYGAKTTVDLDNAILPLGEALAAYDALTERAKDPS